MSLTLHTLNFPDDRAVAIDGGRRVVWGEFRAMIAARQLASSPRRRVLLDSTAPLEFAADLLAALANDHVAVIPPNFQPQTLAAFAELPAPVDVLPQAIELYTSGSSGDPKCVQKTLHQLEAECDVLECCWGSAAAAATVIATTPHHHIYGLLFRVLWPLLAGRPFDNATIAEPSTLVERLRVAETAVLISSPAQLSRLHQLLDLSALPHKPLLTFSSGGPLDADTAACYQHTWGAAPIEVYGSTESGGIAWRRQDLGLRWTPLPQVQLTTDTDDALLVRSPFLPDEAPLRMEDAAEFDADGTFLLHGRLDRIVKIEEKRLSLPEMEAWLRDHPEVSAAVVSPLTLSGRTVVGAVVALKSEADRKPMIAALREHLRQRFDNVLLPRRWRFVDALPFNERGKLAQAEIARLLEAAP